MTHPQKTNDKSENNLKPKDKLIWKTPELKTLSIPLNTLSGGPTGTIAESTPGETASVYTAPSS